MTRSRLRLGFCAAIGVIAASLANPIVEGASNAGLFGSGSYTDHSNIDVLPAFLAGIGLLALYFVRKAPAILCARALSGNVATLLPLVFIVQVAALYVMETVEQLIVWHRLLGSTVWLGGPLAVSLAIHAAVGLAVALIVVKSRRTLAAATLRVIRQIRAIATLAVAPQPTSPRRLAQITFEQLFPLLGTIGERGPPLAALF